MGETARITNDIKAVIFQRKVLEATAKFQSGAITRYGNT